MRELAVLGRLGLVVAGLTAGCGGSASDTASGGDGGAAADGGGGGGEGADASTVDGSAGSDAGTTTDCTTTVTGDVPEIYKRYFSCVDLSVADGDVVIHTRGLPPYKTNYYGASSPSYAPFDTSRGPEYKANPNLLKEQNITLRVPKAPVSRGITITPAFVDGVVGGATSTYDYKMGPAGVAINSVLLYNPLAAPGDDIDNEKYTFDDYNAHPDQGGHYHYHTTSKGPLEQLVKLGFATKSIPGTAEVELYGVMCDGAFVLGCTELDGSAPSTADLDAQNGHVHDMVGKDAVVLAAGRYHVHLCPTGFASAPRKFTPEAQYYDTCTIQ